MAKPRLLIKTLPHFEGLTLPEYKSKEAAGLDIEAALAAEIPMVLTARGGRALIPTGFCMALERGFEAQIRPRSGLALNHGVTPAQYARHHRFGLSRLQAHLLILDTLY